MVIRDRYEDKVRQIYETTGEMHLIAEQRDAPPVVVAPETKGYGRVIKEWQKEVKVPRWV